MVTRIVKLTFQPERISDFLAFFDTINTRVSRFPGCLGMRLMQDSKRPEIVFTYSNWIDEKALNGYRDSETFGAVWPTIKPWFAEKPEAWTTAIYFEDGSFEPTEPSTNSLKK